MQLRVETEKRCQQFLMRNRCLNSMRMQAESIWEEKIETNIEGKWIKKAE